MMMIIIIIIKYCKSKLCVLMSKISCSSRSLNYYRCADKSLARPGRKQAKVSVRME